jgi:plastocyanin
MAGIVLALAAGCGGGDDGTPTSPSPPPPTGGGTQGTTITIGANGVMNPPMLTVSPGTRVTFTNNDTRDRDMHSDPHPTHGDCPEIDQVGFLAVGQSKQTGNLNTARTCGYHDHNDPDKRGTIRIQ